MDYEIVQATEANLGEVLDVFRNDFARGEPLLSTMLTVETCLQQPFSYLALSKESRELIGMRLSCILTRPEPGERFVLDEECMRTYSPGLQEVLRLDAHLTEKRWQYVPCYVQRVLAHCILSVKEGYRRKGIAKALILHRLHEARAFECDGVVAEASAIGSQKAGASSG
ncbi:acetyltransferase [Aphelenchoides avenae]|nr:acetyltransferase [Aphelenchus avenae]